MRVLVLSDTHVPTLARKLPEALVRESRKCEAIIHSGDLVSKGVVDELLGLGTLFAVHGNQDPPTVQGLLPARRIVELEGRRIGVVHGHAGRGMYTEERAMNSFIGDSVNVVIFGHSHIPMNEEREGTLMFNPGSATAGRGGEGNTFGILDLGRTITAKIERIPK